LHSYLLIVELIVKRGAIVCPSAMTVSLQVRN